MSKILITDDDAMMLRMAGMIVKKLGHEVITAASGTECIEKIRSETPGLTIIDVEMPEMSGLETLEAIRGGGEPIKSAAVCMMTGTPDEPTLKRSAELGAIDCLAKPLMPDAVRSAIEKALS